MDNTYYTSVSDEGIVDENVIVIKTLNSGNQVQILSIFYLFYLYRWVIMHLGKAWIHLLYTATDS